MSRLTDKAQSGLLEAKRHLRDALSEAEKTTTAGLQTAELMKGLVLAALALLENVE